MTEKRSCDQIFLNGAVHTFDSTDRVVQAVAVSAGRILAVGTNVEMQALATSETALFDLQGKTVLPGLIDVHYHFGSSAEYESGLNQIDLHISRVRSLEEVFSVLKQEAGKRAPGTLLLCRGDFWWDQKIRERRFPTRQELDECCPQHPVAIFAGAHVGIANSLALQRAGITAQTPQPGYGSFELDPATGELTGRIAEISSHIASVPSLRFEAKEGLYRHALRLISLGVTSINDLPMSGRDVNIYQELAQEGRLPIRIRFYPHTSTKADVMKLVGTGWRAGFGNDFLRFGGIKLFLDGEWESGCSAMNTAYLMEDWPSGPNNFGQTRFEAFELEDIFALANASGIQVLVHATGDRAIERVLQALEGAQKRAPLGDHRHRIEHGAVYPLSDAQFARMKALGCIPSPQPQFMHSMGDFFTRLFGEEVGRNVMPYKTLMGRHRMCFPVSSDSTGTQPESSNPFWTVWCAVARKTYLGRVIGAEQCLSVTEAVRMMTVYAAQACFEDDAKGSIEPGKLADMVVLEQDVFTIPVDAIKDVQVAMTVLGGEPVYRRAAP